MGEDVAILGLGLIGGSLGLALAAADPSGFRRGWDADPEACKLALARGAVTAVAESPRSAVAGAGLVVLAVPVLAVAPLLEVIGPGLAPGAIVTDVASTKAVIVEAAACLPEGVHFVGGHPMAGSERHGMAHADAGLFSGAVCLVTPGPETPARALEAVERLWRAVGARVRVLSPEAHDQAVAAVSHVPFLMAGALATATAESPDASLWREVAASGYRDMTRLAAGSPRMYADICATNTPAIQEGLRAMAARLAALADTLEDPAATRAWLEAAKAERDAWMRLKEEPRL